MLTKKAAGKLAIIPKGKLKKAETKSPANNLTDKSNPPAPPVLKPGDSKKLKGMS